MSFLHYGLELKLHLDPATVRQAMETIGAHATRGGWVTVTDLDGRQWSLLVSPGIPIWVADDK